MKRMVPMVAGQNDGELVALKGLWVERQKSYLSREWVISYLLENPQLR